MIFKAKNASKANGHDATDLFLVQFEAEDFEDEQLPQDLSCGVLAQHEHCSELIGRLRRDYDTDGGAAESRVDFGRIWLILQAQGFDDEFRAQIRQLYDGIFGNVTFEDDFYGPGPKESIPKGYSGILVVDLLKNGPFIDLSELRHLEYVFSHEK